MAITSGGAFTAAEVALVLRRRWRASITCSKSERFWQMVFAKIQQLLLEKITAHTDHTACLRESSTSMTPLRILGEES